MSTDANASLLRAASTSPIDVDGIRSALAAGADVDTTDSTRRTPLLLAALADDVPAAKALLEAGASPDALDDMRQSPWLVTGVTGSVAMLEAILPYNPDMNLRNRYGGISVIPASERGHVDYVRRVVQTGINVNHVNHLGWTALLEAVILGDGGEKHVEIVKILLGAGADPGIRDKDGVSALKHARDRGYTEMVGVLEGAPE
jgi:ankyrin repeat protein